MEKVRFWSTVREAVSLVLSRKLAFFIYWLLFLSMFLVQSFTYHVDESVSYAATKNILFFLLVSVCDFSLTHFTLTLERQEGLFFPSTPVRRFILYVAVCVAIICISIIVLLLSGIPLIALGVYLEIAKDPSNIALILMLFAGLFIFICVSITFMRLSFSSVAVVVGEKWNFSKMWKLSKGYNLRLFILFCFMVFPSIIFAGVWMGTEGTLSLESVDVVMKNTNYILVDSIINGTAFFLASIFFVVLYQKLLEVFQRRQRDDRVTLAES